MICLVAQNSVKMATSNSMLKWITIVSLILGYLETYNVVHCYTGDVNGFVTMEDPKEWVGKAGDEGPYAQTCSRNTFDRWREPRVESYPEELIAPPESLTPIRINTKETLPSQDQHTLHIYNNPGVYRGYSVAYGFDKNKECLHGADNDCVVSREFGKSRAVVINAERFKEGQNLNYLKDHFLIEETEPFVTIVNVGTVYERVFYEAVFLGGYQDPPDSTRSSHQIDGKSYPMEIYMYFVDESTPSMALTTILVVLVEESEQENLYVKPIVETIEKELYYKERQFIENSKDVVRKAKLYQNLKQSTSYDIFNLPEGDVNLEEIPVAQYSQGPSVQMENSMTSYLEAYENIQALHSKLVIDNDDLKTTQDRTDVLQDRIDSAQHNNTYDFYIPAEPVPQRLPDPNFKDSRRVFYNMLFPGLRVGLNTARGSLGGADPFKWCKKEVTDFINKIYKHITLTELFLEDFFEHQVSHTNLSNRMCNQLVKWGQLYGKTHNFTIMKKISNTEKYDYIKQFSILREQDRQLNIDLVNHFNGSWGWNHSENGPDPYKPKNTYQLNHPFEGAKRFLEDYIKRSNFEIIEADLQAEVKKFYESELFLYDTAQADVTHYMEFGTKTRTMTYPREEIHEAQEFLRMPEDQKQRGPVEFGNQDENEPNIVKRARLSPIKAIIDAEFQISWLMPQNGGYFYYDGSSPLPPCFRAQNVIVFKKPIQMSKRQIEVMSRIPVSFDRDEDIRHTKPIIHETRFFVPLKDETAVEPEIRHAEVNVPVYNEKRNHLFLGIDHVHVNAVDESERIRNIRQQMSVANVSKLFKVFLLLGILVSFIM